MKVPAVIVTAPEWVDIARRLTNVECVIPWPRDRTVREMVAEIPKGRVVDLHGTLRSWRLARALGGHQGRINKRSLSRRTRIWWNFGAKRPSVPELYGEACGVNPASPPWIQVEAVERPYLTLIPGASRATKRWPLEQFAYLGRQWDGPVAVLGGPAEHALCASLSEEIPGSVTVTEKGFEKTIALLSQTDVAVTGDSGLMHGAGAVGATGVSIFGPTSPDDGFFVYRGEAMEQALRCRPCSLHGDARCPLGHHQCMDLSWETIWQAVARLRQ